MMNQIFSKLYENPIYYLSLGYADANVPKSVKPVPIVPYFNLTPAHRTFLIIGAATGALAHILAAYGAHKVHSEKITDELKQIYDTANKFHFYSAFSLMLVPLSRKPMITGSLFLIGMLGFSGSCYYYTLAETNKRSYITPIGAMLTTFGWLSFAL